MNCKKAQELMLTDYLDGEMDEKGKAAVEEHLARCQECKKFAIAAQKVGTGLFFNAQKHTAPEYVWRRVEEAILAQRRQKRAIFTAWRPVLAFASVVIIILAIGTTARLTVNNRSAAKSDILGTDYYDYLTEAASGSSINNSGNFGTSIEKYFM